MQSIAFALRAWFGRASASTTKARDRISPECLALLKEVETRGGWVDEDDQILDEQDTAFAEALRLRLLTLGGGWSVGCKLTHRGREVLATLGAA